MAGKKHQVFIGGTRNDLIPERGEMSRALLRAGAIPMSMEIFAGSPDDPLTTIKRALDGCDFYFLIIGNRYGWPTADGVSFTEKEVAYCEEKGIPFVVFIKDEGAISGHTDYTDLDRTKVQAFRTRMRDSERTCVFFPSEGSLGERVVSSYQRIVETHPRPGWVRADEAGRYAEGDVAELMSELVKLRAGAVAHASAPRAANCKLLLKPTDGELALYILNHGNATARNVYARVESDNPMVGFAVGERHTEAIGNREVHGGPEFWIPPGGSRKVCDVALAPARPNFFVRLVCGAGDDPPYAVTWQVTVPSGLKFTGNRFGKLWQELNPVKVGD